MIEIFLNQFGEIFFLIGFGSIMFFLFGFAGIIRYHSKPKSVPSREEQPTSALNISSKDIQAIAGHDIFATQLDLARAYLETGRKQLARKILDHVRQHGDGIQQQEAGNLLNKFNV